MAGGAALVEVGARLFAVRGDEALAKDFSSYVFAGEATPIRAEATAMQRFRWICGIDGVERTIRLQM